MKQLIMRCYRADDDNKGFAVAAVSIAHFINIESLEKRLGNVLKAPHHIE